MNIVRDFGRLSVNDLDSTSAFFGKVRSSYLPRCKLYDEDLVVRLTNNLSARWIRSKVNIWYYSATPEKIGRNRSPSHKNHGEKENPRLVYKDQVRFLPGVLEQPSPRNHTLQINQQSTALLCILNLPPP